VATDYAEFGLLRANIGRRTAIWSQFVALPAIVNSGLVLNDCAVC
jgi:hypothetical protein